jgi:hypothetical protein
MMVKSTKAHIFFDIAHLTWYVLDLIKLWIGQATDLSDPTSLNILDLSQISCVTSLFLKLLPCIPCLWNASTLSVRQTMHEMEKSKWSSLAWRFDDLSFPCKFTTLTILSWQTKMVSFSNWVTDTMFISSWRGTTVCVPSASSNSSLKNLTWVSKVERV